MLQSKGFRWLESFVAGLIFVIFACFYNEIFGQILRNYAYFKQPTLPRTLKEYFNLQCSSIVITGATVMPHNFIYIAVWYKPEHPNFES